MRTSLWEAMTVLSRSIVTVQAPWAEHPSPDQPPKSERESPTEVSVTVEPYRKAAVQTPGQSIPGGIEVVLPFPSPEKLAVRVKVRNPSWQVPCEQKEPSGQSGSRAHVTASCEVHS